MERGNAGKLFERFAGRSGSDEWLTKRLRQPLRQALQEFYDSLVNEQNAGFNTFDQQTRR